MAEMGRKLAAWGVELLNPEEDQQEQLMGAIRKIKTGRYDDSVKDTLADTAAHLVGRGAEAVMNAVDFMEGPPFVDRGWGI